MEIREITNEEYKGLIRAPLSHDHLESVSRVEA